MTPPRQPPEYINSNLIILKRLFPSKLPCMSLARGTVALKVEITEKHLTLYVYSRKILSGHWKVIAYTKFQYHFGLTV